MEVPGHLVRVASVLPAPGSKDQTQVVRLGHKLHYPTSELPRSLTFFLKNINK